MWTLDSLFLAHARTVFRVDVSVAFLPSLPHEKRRQHVAGDFLSVDIDGWIRLTIGIIPSLTSEEDMIFSIVETWAQASSRLSR